MDTPKIVLGHPRAKLGVLALAGIGRLQGQGKSGVAMPELKSQEEELS